LKRHESDPPLLHPSFVDPKQLDIAHVADGDAGPVAKPDRLAPEAKAAESD
jgi:hypothetical protein